MIMVSGLLWSSNFKFSIILDKFNMHWIQRYLTFYLKGLMS